MRPSSSEISGCTVKLGVAFVGFIGVAMIENLIGAPGVLGMIGSKTSVQPPETMDTTRSSSMEE